MFQMLLRRTVWLNFSSRAVGGSCDQPQFVFLLQLLVKYEQYYC